jgi:molybdopterin molybdotransferase
MISYNEAKAIVLEQTQRRKCKTEKISLEDAVGRVCAEKVLAPINVQPFDNSAMDGFAVRISDLEPSGSILIKAGQIAAGDPIPDFEIQSGQCIEIMTGAPVPVNADAVVPIEQVNVQDNKISFRSRPLLNANIRKAGEDFKKDMDVIPAGQTIYPQHIMPLATLGIFEVTVYKAPKVAAITTGLELESDLSQGLSSGKIYNSNGPYMTSAIQAMGGELINHQTVKDDPDSFHEHLSYLLTQDVDIIVSTGAVSAGKFDFVRKGLEAIGAEILFHKVKMKPGKPNLFARLPNGALYFGLPGNPVASVVGLRFFVQPCLLAMQGKEEEKPVHAKVITPFKKRAGTQLFLKACAQTCDDGLLMVDILDGQASFMVSPFLNMNCWAIAPEEANDINAGDIVPLYALFTGSGLL